MPENAVIPYLVSPLVPNWQNPYTIEYAFKTEVLKSRSGKEQRRALRSVPRKTLQFTVDGTRTRFGTLNRLVERWMDRSIILPELPRRVRLAAAFPGGNTIAALAETAPDWIAADLKVVLVYQGRYETRTVESVDEDEVTFSDFTDTDWPVGTTVHPALAGRLKESMRITYQTNAVSRTAVEFEVIPGSEPIPDVEIVQVPVDSSVYFLLDRSQSLTGAEFADIKAAANAGLDLIEDLIIATGKRADVGVRFYASSSSAIERTNCDAADISDIRTFIALQSQQFGGDVNAAMGFVEDWFVATAAESLEKRVVIFITDSTTEDGMTAASTGVCADMLDRGGGTFNLDDGTAVDMYAFNYVSEDTTWTSLLDNTPGDDVPVITSGDYAALEAAVEAALTESALGGDPYAGETFNGRETFMTKFNWATSPEVNIASDRETVDYDIGQIAVFTPVDFRERVVKATFLGRNFEEAEALRLFFERMLGQLGEFYMPTWMPDIEISGTAASGTATLTVEGTEFARDFDDSLIHKAICVFLRDGTTLYRRVSSIAEVDGNSVITVTENWPSDLSAATVRMISWFLLCRHATDTLAIEWQTNTVAQLQFTIQSLEDVD